MSCIFSICQHNRGIHVKASPAKGVFEGLDLTINIGRNEICLHCNSTDDAERMAKDILSAVAKLVGAEQDKLSVMEYADTSVQEGDPPCLPT